MSQAPFEVTFRNIDRSAGLEQLARERMGRLSSRVDPIRAARVTIEARQRAPRKVRTYDARVELSLPCGTIVIGRSAMPSHSPARAQGALRSAFDAVERRLERHRRRVSRGTQPTDPAGGLPQDRRLP